MNTAAKVFTDDEIDTFYDEWEFSEEDPGRSEFCSLVREIEHRLLTRLRHVEMATALRPFARWASGFGPYGRDDSWVIATTPSGKTLTMGDVRRAHAVIERLTADNKAEASQ